MSQEVDVDVRSASENDDTSSSEARVGNSGGQGCSARWFNGKVKKSPIQGDGRKDLVVGDDQDIIDEAADQGERQFAAPSNGETVRECVNGLELCDSVCLQRKHDSCGAFWLDADDLHAGLQLAQGD